MEPGNPHMFWSASEDGCVRQFDARDLRHKTWDAPNIILAVSSASGAGPSAAHRISELKALDINPTAPHLLAVRGGPARRAASCSVAPRAAACLWLGAAGSCMPAAGRCLPPPPPLPRPSPKPWTPPGSSGPRDSSSQAACASAVQAQR